MYAFSVLRKKLPALCLRALMQLCMWAHIHTQDYVFVCSAEKEVTAIFVRVVPPV